MSSSGKWLDIREWLIDDIRDAFRRPKIIRHLAWRALCAHILHLLYGIIVVPPIIILVVTAEVLTWITEWIKELAEWISEVAGWPGRRLNDIKEAALDEARRIDERRNLGTIRSHHK